MKFILQQNLDVFSKPSNAYFVMGLGLGIFEVILNNNIWYLLILAVLSCFEVTNFFCQILRNIEHFCYVAVSIAFSVYAFVPLSVFFIKIAIPPPFIFPINGLIYTKFVFLIFILLVNMVMMLLLKRIDFRAIIDNSAYKFYPPLEFIGAVLDRKIEYPFNRYWKNLLFYIVFGVCITVTVLLIKCFYFFQILHISTILKIFSVVTLTFSIWAVAVTLLALFFCTTKFYFFIGYFLLIIFWVIHNVLTKKMLFYLLTATFLLTVYSFVVSIFTKENVFYFTHNQLISSVILVIFAVFLFFYNIFNDLRISENIPPSRNKNRMKKAPGFARLLSILVFALLVAVIVIL